MAQAQVADFGAYRARRAGVALAEPLKVKAEIAAYFRVSEKQIERWQNGELFNPPLPKVRSGRRMVRYDLEACRAWHAEMFSAEGR